MPYDNYSLGLFLKSLALMTGCILYQLKVLSVKLGGVMCQNLGLSIWNFIISQGIWNLKTVLMV